MNYNRLSVSPLEKDYTTTRCNRAKLDTGTFCNYNCEFCYYLGDLDKVTSFDVIKERIDILYKYGITEVDLSGGESSVHKNWFDILDYCNERFDHISCLSNGWAFAREKFVIKSKEHGLREILFSVHGYDEESHDTIVRKKGAWKRILQAIELCQKYDIIVRINCTVYQRNYNGLLQYSKVINDIKPLEVNYLTLNYWDNNKDFEPIEDYTAVTDMIKKCIDRIKDSVTHINVRYTPYCFMKGYEQYVCNQYQHIYDIYDWNKEIYDYDVDVDIKYSHEQKIDMGYNRAKKDRVEGYKKPKECLQCKHFYICDGIENEVTCNVLPDQGDKITDVNHYRKGFYEQSALTR